MIRRNSEEGDSAESGGISKLRGKLVGLIDQKFPLFMFVFQQVRIPMIVVYPFMLFFFLQVIIVSLWPWGAYWQNHSDSAVMKWLQQIFFYIPRPATTLGFFSQSLVFFSFNIINLFFVRFQIIYYKFRRKFVNFLYYPIRFYYDTILVASYVPVLIECGETFYLIAKGSKDAQIIIAFILNLLSLIYESYAFVTVQSFASKSVCVNLSPLFNFDPSIMIYTLYTMLSVFLLFFILLLFESWAQLFAIVIHLFTYSYLLYYTVKHMPFVDTITLSLTIGWFSSCNTADICIFIGYFVPNMSTKIPLSLTLCAFAVFSVVGFIIIHFRMKWLHDLMKEDRRDQEQADIYYTNIGLDWDEDFALICLRYSFINTMPPFYNMTLINYILDRYDSELILCTCLHLVNFFPKEIKMKQKIKKILQSKRSLNYLSRFLIYQVNNVSSLRQYVETEESKLKHIELRTLSRQVETITRYAIENNQLNPNYFEYLSQKASKVRSIWKEQLASSPNNPRTCDEFSRYLLECECDFPEAIKLKNRQDVIELGFDFSIDYSFRSMIAAFPNYLIKRIVDFHGKIIAYDEERQQNNEGETNNSFADPRNNQAKKKGKVNRKLDEYLQDDEALETEIEEYIGKRTLILSKTRLALHRFLENKIPMSIRKIKLIFLIVAIIIVAVFITGISLSSYYLYQRAEKMKQLDSMSASSFYSGVANIGIVLSYYNSTGKFKRFSDKVLTYIKDSNSSNSSGIIDIYSNMLRNNLNFTTLASSNFQTMVSIFADLAMAGEDIYDFTYSLIKPVIYMTICDDVGNTVNQIYTSYGSMQSTVFANQRLFSNYDNITLKTACEITYNFRNLYYSSNYLFTNVSSFQRRGDGKLLTAFTLIYYILPPFVFLFVFVPFLVIHFMTRKSMYKIIQMIHSFDINDKQFAKGQISINAGEEESTIQESHVSRKFGFFLLICIFFVSVIFLALSFLSARIILNSIDDLQNLNVWNRFSSQRLALSTDLFNVLILTLVKKDIPDSYDAYSMDDLIVGLQYLVHEFVQADDNLIGGTNSSNPCYGYDAELDELNVGNSIDLTNVDSPQKYYSEVSIHSQISIFSNYIDSLIYYLVNATSTEIPTSLIANLIYLSNYNMWQQIMKANDLITRLAYDGYYKSMNLSVVVIIIIFVFLFILYIIVHFYYMNRDLTYKAILFVVKRFSPYALLSNKMFNEIFLSTKPEESNDTQSLEYTIIKNSQNAIFFTNTIGIVEQSNQGVNTLLGYTPEQVLGQLVQTFLTPKDMDDFTVKLDQMKNNQSSYFIEEDYTAIADNMKTIPVHLTLIGMKKENVVNSFVVLMQNIENLTNQKKQAEEAKMKSEKLLYQILPRDVVLKLNKGEKDITFVVPSATIIFIDINKFSEYSKNLTPQAIMSNLSYYFAQLDRVAGKYGMIHKIKLIGDIYMAASGLFNPDSPPESHAEQAVQFSLACLDALDDVNIHLDSHLEIRIGINSGGPLIAGVLGTDKPAFDIIGDPINVAARLQSTSEVNKVHVSQATLSLINNITYEVTPRGETFLKGKGKQLTYYITIADVNINDSPSQSKIELKLNMHNMDGNPRNSLANLDIFSKIAQSKSVSGNLLLLPVLRMSNNSTTNLLGRSSENLSSRRDAPFLPPPIQEEDEETPAIQEEE